MRTLSLLALAVALFAATASPAEAQRYFGGFTGYSYGEAAGECDSLFDDCPDRRTGYGIVFGSLGGGIGFEQEIAWTPDFFGETGDLADSNVLTVMSNLIVSLPIGAVRPYGAFGIGLMKAKAEFSVDNLSDFSDTSFGWDYGFGVMVMLPAHLGIRADYRRFRSSAELPFTGLEDNKLRFSRATIGVVLH
jgi:opacity protein-like surface antigen